MKRILVIALVIVTIVILMAACQNKTEPEPVAVDEHVTAEYTAMTYLVDNWKEEDEDGVNKTYYTTIFMNSDNLYCLIDDHDIKYLTDNGYVPLTDAIKNSSVVVYSLNKIPNVKTHTYAKITTNELIDIKKIFVQFRGMNKYLEGVTTKEDYEKATGSSDGWQTMLTSISENNGVPNTTTIQTPINRGVVRILNNKYSQYYYSSENPESIMSGSTMLTNIYVDTMNDGDLEALIEAIEMDGGSAKIINGAPEEIELDSRLKVVGKIVDGQVWLGFETVDGSDFSEYDGEIPDAITYKYNKTHYFIVQ